MQSVLQRLRSAITPQASAPVSEPQLGLLGRRLLGAINRMCMSMPEGAGSMILPLLPLLRRHLSTHSDEDIRSVIVSIRSFAEELIHEDIVDRLMPKFRENGCMCHRPVLGFTPGLGYRCRVCDTHAGYLDDGVNVSGDSSTASRPEIDVGGSKRNGENDISPPLAGSL